MALAVLIDLVGEGLQTPLLGLGNLAAVVANDRRERFGELLDLSGRDVLACDEHALVIRHLVSPWLLAARSCGSAICRCQPFGPSRTLGVRRQGAWKRRTIHTEVC